MYRSRILIVASLALFVLSPLGCGSNNSGQSPDATATGEGGQGGFSGTASIPGKGGPASDPLHPLVVMETTQGTISIRLDAQKAPLTVDNFLAYVKSGHYRQTIFHQVFKSQGILGGGYTVDGAEKPTRTPIRNEADNGLKNRRGTIAMVRDPATIDSARSQFFFNLADNELLDHRNRTPEGYGYCVFGEVVGGMEVLERIATAPLHDTPQFERTPVEPIIIKDVRVVR
jgi:cyclophilin family peptidyl-prolyl cis-trans isomerase